MPAINELAEYRMTAPLPVRFRDTDAMGHVNNAVYLTYLEQGRVAYLKRVLGMVKPAEFGIIVARIEIDYRSPAEIDDELLIGTRVIRLGGASFDMDYKIAETRTGRLIAQAKSVQVFFDYSLNKVRRIPEDVMDKVREFDGIS